MLQNLLNLLTPTNRTSAYPGAGGSATGGIPFGKIISGLLGSFTGAQTGLPSQAFGSGLAGFNQAGVGAYMPGGFGGGNRQAMQAYTGIQNQFANNSENVLKNRALSPGAALIDSLKSPSPTGYINSPPSFSPGITAQSPFAGYAGQAGLPGGFGNPAFAGPGQLQYAQNGFPQTQTSKWQYLLFPLIGIFSLVKSLFGLRNVFTSLQPVQVDKTNLGYYNFQDYVSEQYKEGSFDEADDYDGSGFAESFDKGLSNDF